VSTSEALVIGAGPFGVSISAHLRGLGVDHQIVGRPMDTWRAHMPPGMLLKSEPYASEIASPKGGYDLAAYYKLHGWDYINRAVPIPLDRFLGYADWYIEQLVPQLRDVTAAEITAAGGGFRVAFADAEPVTARKVVIATGVLPYARIPAELSGLPSDLVTHTSEHRELDRFRGRRVAVVGAGQSALETAALLHEAGADVTIVARIPEINWIEPNPAKLSRLGHIRRPVTQLCEGWHCAFWNTPAAFRRLPKDVRITKARTVLGPNGSAWLKDRVHGVIPTLTGHRVREAVPHGSGVRLLLDGQAQPALDGRRPEGVSPGGRRPAEVSLDVDHVVAGTGFRIDLTRLPFLPDALRTQIATVNGYPVVSRDGESTVPGLYFVGAPTAVSIGPSARFIAGTHNMAAKVARSVARRTGASRGNPVATADDGAARSSGDAAIQQAV
jgi:pyridine nucleotide-disulfide oxidoreductase